MIGIDESTGAPITVPYVYDAVANTMTVTLADGESVLATMEYEVSDRIDTTLGQITVNFTDLAEPGSVQSTLDFEPFAADPGFQIVLDTLDEPLSGSDIIGDYEGFIFQDSATAYETDELAGGGRGGEGNITAVVVTGWSGKVIEITAQCSPQIRICSPDSVACGFTAATGCAV